MPIRWEVLNPKGPRDWDCLVMAPFLWEGRSTLFAIGGLSSDRGTIVRSDDSGASWARVDLDSMKRKGSARSFGKTPGLRQIATGSGDRVLACGEYGTVLGSNDGGVTWKQAKPPIDGCLFGIIERPDDGRIWVSGDEGIWHRPIGSGKWVQADDTPGLARMYPVGSSYVVVGDNGTLLEIQEDDSVRRITECPAKDDLYGFAFFTGEQRVLVGNNGLILRWDGGREFTKVESGVDVALMNVVDAGRSTFIAAGHRQTVLVSGDSGVTWRREQGPKDSGNLWGICMEASGSFLVSGDDGLIARGHIR